MRLCFGSYLAVLVSCKATNVDNKDLCEALFNVAAPDYIFVFNGRKDPNRAREDASSKMRHCTQNVPPDVVKGARKRAKTELQDVMTRFASDIAIMIDESRLKNIILALKDIIAKDSPVRTGKKVWGIDDDTIVDLVSGITKRQLATTNEFHPYNFLAGLLLFVIINTNNRSGKASIGSVSDDYVLSFAGRTSEITLTERTQAIAFVKQATEAVSLEVAVEIAALSDKIDSLRGLDKPEKDMIASLFAEARGKCLSCGGDLGQVVRGIIPSANFEIFFLTLSDTEAKGYHNGVALCSAKCAKSALLLSDEEKMDLLERKRHCSTRQAYTSSIDGIQFPKEIEQVLRAIHESMSHGELEETPLEELVEIGQKINEPYLKHKTDTDMVMFYKEVKAICGRLEQVIGFDTELFGSMMKAAQRLLAIEIANKTEILSPQRYITKLLVNKLSSQVGQQHEDACDVIVGYLIKRCDLFNETAKQS